MSNPYRSPEEVPSTTPFPQDHREKLRRVAKYQRWVLLAVLLNICATIVAIAVPRDSLIVSLMILAVALAILVFAVTSVVMLAGELWNVGIAILCAILMFLPCISLITLLVVNQKATGLLQQHGIHVGLMGADVNKI